MWAVLQELVGRVVQAYQKHLLGYKKKKVEVALTSFLCTCSLYMALHFCVSPLSLYEHNNLNKVSRV